MSEERCARCGHQLYTDHPPYGQILLHELRGPCHGGKWDCFCSGFVSEVLA